MSNPVATATDGLWAQMLYGRPASAGAAAASGSAAKPAEEPTREQTQRAVDAMNAVLKTRSIAVQFEIDKDIGRAIVQVVDQDTGEVIRQIPSREMVSFAHAVADEPSLLVSQKA